MKINRVWAMPDKWTFRIRPIAELVARYKKGLWADPFCGESKLAEYRNDLDPNNKSAQTHLEADIFMALCRDNVLDGVFFHPPYSLTQVSGAYNNIGIKFKGKENPTGGFPGV